MDLAWYVSYGSNLLAERFATYLTGGLPEGREKPHVGARDSSPWHESRPFTIPHRLLLAGVSRAWNGGGAAFVDPNVGEVKTLARGYLITQEQFQDVLAQESARPVGSEVDLSEAVAQGHGCVGDGFYDMVIYLGVTAGWPMFTFTTPKPIDRLVLNPASETYSATIVDGLRECHGLDQEKAREYLAAAAI